MITNATDEKLTIKIQIDFNIPLERVKDLLTSAFEGGSNYWIAEAERIGEACDRKLAPYLCDCPFVGSLKIRDGEGGNGGWFNIDPATIKKGLQIMAQKYPRSWSDFMNENDDAETADVFLQCVCFGETIYG